MRKQDLVMHVIRGAREYSVGTVLFHRAVGKRLGINVTDVKCLDIIMLKGSATPSELAHHTGLSTGAITTMIDRLERAKLLERHPHSSDRRGTILVLSHQAMRKLPTLFESLANAMQVLLSSYSERDLGVLHDFFSKVAVLWEEERGKLNSSKRQKRLGGQRAL